MKTECLDHMIFFGRKSLENAVHKYVEHYHAERNHQGLGNELIEPSDNTGCCRRKHATATTLRGLTSGTAIRFGMPGT